MRWGIVDGRDSGNWLEMEVQGRKGRDSAERREEAHGEGQREGQERQRD